MSHPRLLPLFGLILLGGLPSACQKAPSPAPTAKSQPTPSATPILSSVAKPTKKEEDATTRLDLARALRNSGRNAEAEAEFRRAMKDLPPSDELRLELAETLAWQGKMEECRAIIQDVRLPDTNPGLARLRAILAIEEKDFSEAARNYRLILQATPEADDIRFQLAETLSWAGDYPASLSEYESLLEKHPDDIYLRRQYARVLGWAGRSQESVEQYKRTLP